MKLFFSFLFVSLSGIVFSQNPKTAIDYNDYVVDLQSRIIAKMIEFNLHVSSEEATQNSAKIYFEDMLKTTKASISELEKLQAWEKDSDLKMAAMTLFRFYEKTIDQDYRRIIQIIYDPIGMTEETQVEFDEILTRITDDEAKIDEQFQTEQTKFAKKNGFMLIDNELQEEVDKL